MREKIISTFSFPVTFRPQIVPLVTLAQLYDSTKVEVSIAFLFRERHGTDGRTECNT